MHTSSLRICKRPGTGVIAEGSYDELSAALLKRAGFVPVSTPHSSWCRAPYDLEPAEEQEIASNAYAMLNAARYEVSITPELRLHPTAGAREATEIGAEIADASDLDTVTALLSTLSDVDNGTLIATARLICDAANWVAAESVYPGRDSLANTLISARRAMESAQEYLEDAVNELSAVPEALRARRTSRATAEGTVEPRVVAARARSAETAGPSVPLTPSAQPPATGRQPSSSAPGR
ncbi:hypothetical protein [Streptomyces acidiscabies]|uniref:hypothetical protein n=1 Tax=Streptomyces acidiscabies TaxID=42234 RepID=UPI00067D55B0|nr:hypothetical protein [Streptomyces acidiscabies]